MCFNSKQKIIFENNIKALKDERLKARLSEIKGVKFKCTQGSDALDINLELCGGGVIVGFMKAL